MKIMGYPSSLLDALHQEQDVYENYGGHEDAINISRKLLHSNGDIHNNDAAFYDEDGSLSAFGVGISVFGFATLNILVILFATGISTRSLWGNKTDHTSLYGRCLQGCLALMGIVVPIVVVIRFQLSLQEGFIIIFCGVILPYLLAAVVYLLCYAKYDDDEEEEPTNNDNPEEPEFDLEDDDNAARRKSKNKQQSRFTFGDSDPDTTTSTNYDATIDMGMADDNITRQTKSDLELLEEMMLEAAESKDFISAAKFQKLIEKLRLHQKENLVLGKPSDSADADGLRAVKEETGCVRFEVER